VAEPTTAGAFIEARILRGLRLAALGVLLVVTYGLRAPVLILTLEWQRRPDLALAALGLLAVVTVVIAVQVIRDRPFGRLRWPLLGLVLAANVLGTIAVQGHFADTSVHWTFSVVGWFAVMLLLDRPIRELVLFLSVVSAITLAQMVATGTASRLSLAHLALTNLHDLGFQLTLGLAASALRRVAATAAVIADRRERLAIEEAVADGLHRARRERYARLSETALPLLAGIASGELRPDDPEARRACALEAARMRRLFAEGDEVGDRLVHELRACIELAERQGLTIELAVLGTVPELTREVRGALAEPAVALVGAAAGTARVAVVGGPDSVSVSVVADGPDIPTPASSSPDVDVTVLTEGDRHWVEATWRARAPA
jgi:hypothetical protein